ncbi:MAG: hypothetical protein LBH95_10405 [Oscillospiraceae bacterium]|jgi:hypothetical protein|nr:hypothetical protein [Oscillospiraceae bacterium]
MELSVTLKQFRRLLDLVYIGNWVLNSARGDDRIVEFDEVESLLFAKCRSVGMQKLTESLDGSAIPSRAFAEGGIHEAIMDYEDTIFFEILAEELARRDVIAEGGTEDDAEQINERIGAYIAEFERNGTDNIVLNL